MKKNPLFLFFFFPLKVCPCLALWPQAGLLLTCTSLHTNTERVHGAMALILFQCCSNMLSNNTGRKSNSIVSTAPLGPPFIPILQEESPSLRSLLSEVMPSCGAAQNKTGSSSFEVHQKNKTPHTQKQPQIWQSVRPPPKVGVTRYLLPLRESRLFLWLLLPFSQMHEPLVLMRSYRFREKKITYWFTLQHLLS